MRERIIARPDGVSIQSLSKFRATERNEVPVIPQRFLSAKFRGKDGAKRGTVKKKLAGFDLRSAGNEKRSQKKCQAELWSRETSSCSLTMSSQISGSVGRWEKGAQNLQADVKTVQRLLEAAAKTLQAPELDPNGVDGKIAKPSSTSGTVSAIEAFQRRFTRAIDGLIEPDSQTWRCALACHRRCAERPASIGRHRTVPVSFPNGAGSKLGTTTPRVRLLAGKP